MKRITCNRCDHTNKKPRIFLRGFDIKCNIAIFLEIWQTAPER